MERKDDVLFVSDCVGKLAEIYRIPLELRYFHGLKNPEIAEILGIKTHNVAMRISRAIAELRKIIGKRVD
jgi:RNA polymerase sigma factor (sigma-70 family)